MSPSNFILLVTGTLTFVLMTTVSSETVLIHEYVEQSSEGKGGRVKRSYESDLEITRDKLSLVEDEVRKCRSDVEQLQEFVKTLGLNLNSKDQQRLKLRNACESDSSNEEQEERNNKWIKFGASKCVKVMEGLHTFNNGAGLCRQQYIQGKDVAQPGVVSLNSERALNKIRRRLGFQKEVTSVWVNLSAASSPALLGTNCTELRIPGVNSSLGVTWTMADCEEIKTVVCEKPIPVPYGKLEQRTLKGNQRVRRLKRRLRMTEDEMKSLKARTLRLEKNMDEGLTHLSTKFNSLLKSIKSESSEEIEEPRVLEVKSKEPKVNIPSCGTDYNEVDSEPWESKSGEMFQIGKAMGDWYTIEVIKKGILIKSPYACEEYSYRLSVGVDFKHRYKVNGELMTEEPSYYNVKRELRHKWMIFADASYWREWVSMDYGRWGVLKECGLNEYNIPVCDTLLILSRSRTLDFDTLERLRVSAEELGFREEGRTLVNQTVC